MLAYTANLHPARRAGSPGSLILILAGHAVLIGAVMTAKLDLAGPAIDRIPTIFNVPVDPPPPQTLRIEPQTKKPLPQDSFIKPERSIVDMHASIPSTAFDQGQLDDITTVIGSALTSIPLDPPKAMPVRIAARFATPDGALKPPYPLDMSRAEQEATLRLKLTIDPRGRVIAVDPVSPANPSFLEAARRHILRAWRYKPATEDGLAVPSTTVINLSFRLEDM